MHLRPYLRTDLSQAADVVCSAFMDDDLWEFQRPHRRRYPLSFHAYAVQKHKSMLLNPAAYGFVCVTDAEDGARLVNPDGTPIKQDTILGYAWWVRGSPSTDEDAWIKGRRASWSDAIERRLIRLEALYEQYICPNPVISPENVRAYNEDLASNDRFAQMMKLPHWHLGALAVRPKAQGKGAGRLLLSWGQDRAQQARTWIEMQHSRSLLSGAMPTEPQLVTLIATPKGRILYERAGFRILCDEQGEPEISPRIKSLPRHYVMVYDPTGYYTSDILAEEASDGHTMKNGITWKGVLTGPAQEEDRAPEHGDVKLAGETSSSA